MPRLTPRPIALALCSALFLAGCESDADKAARYYQSAMTLLEAGDADRALVELRNVFKYDGFHKEAREAYADIMLDRGEVTDAYSQLLRLVEQYPDTLPARRTLAELAILRGDWAEAERHGRAALELAPGDDEAQVLGVALDYHKANRAHDDDARAKAGQAGLDWLAKRPDDRIARRVAIDYLLRSDDHDRVLALLDDAIAAEPETFEFHMLKLRLLFQARDSEAIGRQLEVMQKAFPDNAETRDMLIRWYLSRGELDEAEALLRDLAGEATGSVDGHMALAQFLEQMRGADAARAELEALVAANDGTANADVYRATLAGMDFNAGRRDEAIAAVEAILRDAEPSDQTRRIKLALAQMLDATGNRVGARARVEEILEEDTSNVEALKLRAGWLIAEDRPRDAIIDLRNALDQSPRDSAALILMARAHEREGDMDLAGERLAAAVEASDGGAVEALTYARFLMAQDKAWVARRVLTDARRSNPRNAEILSMLAGLHVNAGEWAEAREILATLREIDSQQARDAGRALEAAILAGEGTVDEALAYLQGEAEGGDIGALAMAVQSLLRTERPDEARALLDRERAKNPDDLRLAMLSANLHAATGELDAAEAELRALLAEAPGADAAVQLLYSILAGSGRGDEAGAVLDTALAAQPEAQTLLLLQAGRLEQAGDIDGAIAIYDDLYTRDSNNVVVANNLASLIATHRDDAEGLERAYAVARRLRDSDVPAFNDTYGWIAYRRGDHDEALRHLEPAAAGLPQDPLVQFHLGMTYLALDRPEDAARLLQAALDLAGDSPLPQFATAREALDKLAAQP